MAGVTKDLLIRISTEGGDTPAAALNSANSAIDNMLGSMTGLNQAWELFNKILGIVQTTAGYAFSAMSQLTSVGSTFEQLGIRFDAIFGKDGSAQAALDWAVQFAATTPLTLEQVTERMLKLKTYGFDPMNGTLQTIGDAAYMLGTDFDGVVVALGQMALKGKVVQQELNQLSERNIPAVRWLREELGLAEQQMGDIGNQAIKSDVAIGIILRRMQEEYAGGMKRASDSWAGAISTIQDNWTIFQKNIMDSGPFKFLVENIRMVRDEFSAFVASDTGRAFAANIGGVIESYLRSWWSFLVENVQPAFLRIVPVVDDIFTIIKNTWDMLKDWKFVIDIALIAFEALAATLRDYSDILKAIYDLVKMTFIQPIIDAHNLYVSFINSVYEASLSVFSKIKEYVSDFMLDLLQGKGASFLDMLGIGSGSINDAKAYFSELKDEAIKSKTEIDMAYAAKPAAPVTPYDYPYADAPIIYSGELREMSQYKQQPQAQPSAATAKDILATMQTSGGVAQVQLLPPPGDDLMTLIVKYLNQCIKSEGTIGAGF